MLKVIDQISNRVYYIPEGKTVGEDICLDGYILENNTHVLYIKDKWLDNNDREYTAVYEDDEIVGFVLMNKK